RDVRSVDPRATGNPLQAYEASLEMKRSYEQAAMYSLVVILAVLLLDFRSIVHTLLAVMPLAIGMAQTLGLMGLLGIPLNPANLVGIPLVLGIAVDYGVHIVHDALERPGRYRISPSTANSVLVDAVTTILGFGALMVASHRGLESLGRLLTLGVAACTATSLILLPAVLRLLPVRSESSMDSEASVIETSAPTVVGVIGASGHPPEIPCEEPVTRVTPQRSRAGDAEHRWRRAA
ncbi:MAG: MMPL family transporter, partial [Planctomycetaceae bacterium]